MVARIRTYLPAIALLLLLWSSFTLFAYFRLLPNQVNFDFYPRWVGVHEMFRGQNPYDLLLTPEYLTQNGYPVFVSQRFLYFATIAWILLPFWLLPMKLAVSLWSALQLILILLLPLRFFTLLGWKVKPLSLVAILLVSTIGNIHSMNMFVLGQFVAFILACLVIAWWQIVDDNPLLAALALVGATIRPEGCVLVAVVLLDQLLHLEFKVVAIWLAVMAVIFGLTVLQIGFWVPDFLAGVFFYEGEGISNYPPNWLGTKVLTWLFVAAILGWGIYMLAQVRQLPDRIRLPWLLSISILVVLLVLPQTHDYTLLYALFPIWFVIWLGQHNRLVLPLCLLLILFSWVVRQVDSESLYLAQQFWVPLCLVAALTFYRLRANREADEVYSFGMREGQGMRTKGCIRNWGRKRNEVS